MSVGTKSRSIDDLHPAVARGCRELIRRMADAGYTAVGVSDTFRDNAHQDWLHAQGRTRPGNIVTNARGGQSMHNYRLAFDIFQNIRDKEWNDPNFFKTAGRIWTGMGGVWGGNWASFPDRPHLEYTGGLTLRELQDGRTLQGDARMPWEKNYIAVPANDAIALDQAVNIRYRGATTTIKAANIEGRYITSLNELSKVFGDIEVPVRALLELAGFTVDWEADTRTIVIT